MKNCMALRQARTASASDPNCASANRVGHGGEQRTEERNIVQHESEHAPGRRELDAREQRECPYDRARQQAHLRPHLHVSLIFHADFARRLQDGLSQVAFSSLSTFVAQKSRPPASPSTTKAKTMTRKVTRL